jgi:hypothetical protein
MSPKKPKPEQGQKRGPLAPDGSTWAAWRQRLLDMPEPTHEQWEEFKNGPLGDPGRKRK